MTNGTITVGARSGGVCILNTAAALRQTVFDAADAVGCGKFVPQQPALTTTLRLAMPEIGKLLYGKRKKQPIVARHIDANSFECVRVVAVGDRNEYQHLFSAEIDTNWHVRVLAHNHDRPSDSLHAALNHMVARLRDYLPAPVVGQVTVRILMSWKAVSMADGGGVWFLADDHIDKFRTFASRLRPNGTGPKFTITTFDIAANPETVEEVLAKVRATVSEGVAEIMKDVSEATGGMNDRSINVRIARANKLLALVEQYQSLTGIAMPELTDAIEQCKQAVAINRLLAAAV